MAKNNNDWIPNPDFSATNVSLPNKGKLISNELSKSDWVEDPRFAASQINSEQPTEDRGQLKLSVDLESDYTKSLQSGVMSGAGMIAQGGGELLARTVNNVLGTKISAENPLQSAIDYLESSKTEGAKKAQAESQISGSLFSPSTWEFGADPSVKGLALQGLNAIGQFAPNLAIAIATAGASVPVQLTVGATVGGLQALGGGSEDERTRFMAMSYEDLDKSSGLYRELISKGVAKEVAKEAVAEAAALGGGIGNAIPSAAEGAFENFLIGALTRGRVKIPAAFGKGIAGKTVTGVVAGGAMGGTEEAVEQIGQNIGSNIAAQAHRPITDDTLQQFVMGALAEGVAGGGGAMAQHTMLAGEQAKQDAKKIDEGQPVPTSDEQRIENASLMAATGANRAAEAAINSGNREIVKSMSRGSARVSEIINELKSKAAAVEKPTALSEAFAQAKAGKAKVAEKGGIDYKNITINQLQKLANVSEEAATAVIQKDNLRKETQPVSVNRRTHNQAGYYGEVTLDELANALGSEVAPAGEKIESLVPRGSKERVSIDEMVKEAKDHQVQLDKERAVVVEQKPKEVKQTKTEEVPVPVEASDVSKEESSFDKQRKYLKESETAVLPKGENWEIKDLRQKLQEAESDLAKNPNSKAIIERADKARTNLENKLTEKSYKQDVVAQTKYLVGIAKQKGYDGLGEFAKASPKEFATAAADWRKKHPITTELKQGEEGYATNKQTDTPEFKQWFGDSKVVDADGKPLVVYHGTEANITEFKNSERGLFGNGVYLTSSQEDADQYGPSIPVYAALKRPFYTKADYDAGEEVDLESPAIPMVREVFMDRADEVIQQMKDTDGNLGEEVRRELEGMGHDGIVVAWPDGLQHIIAFEPTQIKSATGNKGTFDPSKASILEQNEEQYGKGDIYENIEVRPDTTEKQKQLGRDAYKALLSAYARRAGASVLGSQVAADFRERGGTEMHGKTVKTPEDFAILAQILRDPRIEKFRIFYTKDDKIVGHDVFTSNMPGAVQVANKQKGETIEAATRRATQEMKKQMDALGANGYWLEHNHPSGRAKPSEADIQMTQFIADRVSGFNGHIIIDHNEYGHLFATGIMDTIDTEVIAKELPKHFTSESYEVPHDLLNRKIQGTLSVIEMAKTLEKKEGFFTMIGYTAQAKTSAIAEFPSSLLQTGAVKELRLHATLKRFAAQSGSVDMVAVIDRSDIEYMMGLVERGVIQDAVTREMFSVRDYVKHGTKTLFGKPKSIQLAEQNEEQYKARPPKIIGDSGRQYTEAQIEAMKRTGSAVTQKTIKETLQEINNGLWKKIAQGVFDQFAPIKDIDKHAYTLMRLSKGATGAFEAFMRYGKLKIRDGTTDADNKGGVLEKVFYPLGRETDDFLRWIAGNRAERLQKIGKEHLFTNDDIAAFKSLSEGNTNFDYVMPDKSITRDRAKIYADSLKKFNEFNKNILDIAAESGLIDNAGRALWEHEFYVPFYRIADEEGEVHGMNIKGSPLRQEAFKRLKGGKEQLNDLLSNTMMNWHHLIDASAKNRAAVATLNAAEKLGAARKAEPGETKTVWVMENGEKVHYKIEDPALITALSSLEYAGMRGLVWNILAKPKHWLTIGVTASPFFKIRNLIRDSMQSIATADLSYNIGKNIVQGYKLTGKKSPAQEYISALAGGGLIRFGTMLEGSEAGRTRNLIKQGIKDYTILDDESKLQQFYSTIIEPAIEAYNELGNRGEEVNRMSLYHQLTKKGMSHEDASLAARDLLDFSMQGSWNTIRALTQVVPFFNARLQGMYKLGRAAKEDKARFATVLGAVSILSLALLAAYHDDDDWKKREDWDRDNYWWFKFGGVAYRIPKPFEIGAIATLAERSAELAFDDEMTGKRFRKTMTEVLANQLSMNPVPQAVKPIVDIYSNKDSFTGRPIEPMGMEKIEPEYRYTQRTSLLARGASTAMGGALSPVQTDHLVRSYFGWLGATSVSSADMLIRSVSNEPTKPAVDYWKLATGGMVADLSSAQSRYVTQMYEQSKELEQSYGTWKRLLKEGKTLEAGEYFAEHKTDIGKYKSVAKVRRVMSILNERIRSIERGDKTPEEKRDLINQIKENQNRIAKQLAR